MLCKFPTIFPNSRTPAPCGQCLPCRINARRVWANRMICEAADHEENAFLTLTYDDDHLPSDGSLNKTDHQHFMWRFRENLSRRFGRKVRFYMVGEYGEKSWRPHYHYALFGYPSCPYGGGHRVGVKFQPCRCPVCKLVSDAWGLGNVFLGSLTPDSANYVAQYVTKKMTSKDDPRLGGLHPEFALMSKGIGKSFVSAISSLLTKYGYDVDNFPAVLCHGSKSLPLGRYMKEKIYADLGISFNDDEKRIRGEARLLSMFLHPSASKEATAAFFAPSPFAVQRSLEMLNHQRAVDIENKVHFFRKESKL